MRRSCSVACFKQHQAETCKATASASANSSAAAGAAAIAAAPSAATPAVAAAPALPPPTPSVSKAATERVSAEDLDRLASTPSILSALNSTELQNILRRIDGGGGQAGKGGREAHPPSDEQRVAALEKYRAANSDFEAFVQDVLQVINKE